MITQEKIDNYNYMLKASDGIILIKPEEFLYQRNFNNKYRNIEDILYNIDDINDNCEMIGIGVDPYSNELFNYDILSYNNLESILKAIRNKFINIPIFITCTIESLTESNINLLNKYANISLNIDLYSSFIKDENFNLLKMKNDFNKLKSLINILPNINSFYIPYYQNKKIDNLLLNNWNQLYPNKYYTYCCDKNANKIDYLNYIENINVNNFIPIVTLEKDLSKELDIKIINIINKSATSFKIGDIILKINEKELLNKEDIYDYFFNTEFETYTFKVFRKNELFLINCDKLFFINNIILNNNLENIFNNIYPDIFDNEKHSLILYPDYNYDIFINTIKRYYSKNSNIEPIFTNDIFNYKKITLEDCKKALNNFRQKNPEKLITTLYIPYKIVKNLLDKGSEISIEDFQIETMTFIILV